MAQKKAQQFSAEVTPIAKKAGTGIGNAIGVLFKAFFLFIAGTIAFSLLIALSIMLYSGIGILPLKNFILEGFWQNALTWSVLLLFIAVPVLAIIVWITRRMMRVKSGNPYLGYIFGGLWVVGLISLFVLIGMVTSNFRNRDNITETKLLEQPSNGSMMVKLSDERLRFYRNDFFDGELPFFSANHDSMLLNTVRVKVVQSEDSNYNFKLVKFSRGSSPLKAEENAQNVTFDVQQNDSVLLLPKGFPVSSKNKFRNQQVLAILEVPVGKKVMIDRSIDGYNWFDLTINRRKGWTIEWDDKWNKDFNYRFNVPYVMTSSGLQQIGKSETDSEKPADDGSFKMKIDKDGIEIETGPKDEKYRYRPRNQRKNNPEDNTPSTAPAAANSQNAKLETHIPFMLITG